MSAFAGLTKRHAMARPSRGPRYFHHAVGRQHHGSQYTSLEFTNRLDDWDLDASYGTVGDYFDNAAMESTWGTIKKEIRHIWGPWEEMTRSQLRTVLFEYIEVFYNRQRHGARLGHHTPAETYAASRAA